MENRHVENWRRGVWPKPCIVFLVLDSVDIGLQEFNPTLTGH